MADGPSSSASPPTEAPSERPPPEPGVLRWAVERRPDEVLEAAVTPAVERIWRVAATLTSEAARRQNLAFDRPPLLAAILASATNVGDWARRWNGGAAFGAALDHAKVGASRATGADPDVETRNLWLVSASADELLRDAQDLTPAWASMDAHHLVGAIILSRYGNDPFVKDDDVRQRWAIDFGRYIDRYFRKDVGNWETHIRRRFPDITLPAYHAELAKVPRSDRWAELDELGREPFVDALAQLLLELNREEKVTLVVVTHAPDLAAKMQQVFEINDGVLRARG